MFYLFMISNWHANGFYIYYANLNYIMQNYK